jgi:hypothetical protein
MFSNRAGCNAARMGQRQLLITALLKTHRYGGAVFNSAPKFSTRGLETLGGIIAAAAS